jgi:hypothetical protein
MTLIERMGADLFQLIIRVIRLIDFFRRRFFCHPRMVVPPYGAGELSGLNEGVFLPPNTWHQTPDLSTDG